MPSIRKEIIAAPNCTPGPITYGYIKAVCMFYRFITFRRVDIKAACSIDSYALGGSNNGNEVATLEWFKLVLNLYIHSICMYDLFFYSCPDGNSHFIFQIYASCPPWWRHDMETLSSLLALWEGNPSLTCWFAAQRACNAVFNCFLRYNDVVMGAMGSQITGLTTVYSIVHSGANQRKHHSSVSLAFVRGIHRWPVNSFHK